MKVGITAFPELAIIIIFNVIAQQTKKLEKKRNKLGTF